MPTARRSTTLKIYQIKITLRDARPPIWRRILMKSNTRLDAFYETLITVMGWHGGHMHSFEIGGESYGVRDPELEMEDEKRLTLAKAAPNEGAKFGFTYDFGDNWQHIILLEKILEPEEGKFYPVCIKGKRNCPPEDCGGVWAYEEFLEAIADPNNPDHSGMLEWVGGEFDPEEFDIEAINRGLMNSTTDEV